jgi:hypothetical protein
MAWKDFGSSLAVTRRRRVLATALMYGLTLTVRFTSATGEDADALAQALRYRDWLPGAALPIGLQHGSLSGARGCRAACMPAARTPFLSSCARQ